MTTRQRQGAGSQQTAAYRALIEIAEEVVASARKALDDTAAMRGKDPLTPLTALNIKALREEIAHHCDVGTRVIGQARRRVLDGEQDLFDLRAAYRSHQAWQSAHARRIWPQSVSRGKRQGLDHSV
jgi:hypothetical protein